MSAESNLAVGGTTRPLEATDIQELKARWQAEALREAAEDIELGDWSHHGNKTDRHNAEAEASTWLENRAAQIEGDTNT